MRVATSSVMTWSAAIGAFGTDVGPDGRSRRIAFVNLGAHRSATQHHRHAPKEPGMVSPTIKCQLDTGEQQQHAMSQELPVG